MIIIYDVIILCPCSFSVLRDKTPTFHHIEEKVLHDTAGTRPAGTPARTAFAVACTSANLCVADENAAAIRGSRVLTTGEVGDCHSRPRKSVRHGHSRR